MGTGAASAAGIAEAVVDAEGAGSIADPEATPVASEEGCPGSIREG
jgi:hypothetical protein